MSSILKAEFRKLLTIRSTYIITLLIGAFMVLFAFYAQGIRADDQSGVASHISNAIINGTSIVGAFAALIGLLLFTHEYRYNTIVYTLTSSTSRIKSLFAKFIVGTTVALVLTAFFGLLIPLLIILGTSLGGHELAPQDIPVAELIWKSLFISWADMMYALLIAAFIRNQVGVIATYFVIPTTVEALLSVLLKDNTVYLPYSAIGAITSRDPAISVAWAVVTVLAYILFGGVAAFVLFVRRDAN